VVQQSQEVFEVTSVRSLPVTRYMILVVNRLKTSRTMASRIDIFFMVHLRMVMLPSAKIRLLV